MNSWIAGQTDSQSLFLKFVDKSHCPGKPQHILALFRARPHNFTSWTSSIAQVTSEDVLAAFFTTSCQASPWISSNLQALLPRFKILSRMFWYCIYTIWTKALMPPAMQSGQIHLTSLAEYLVMTKRTSKIFWSAWYMLWVKISGYWHSLRWQIWTTTTTSPAHSGIQITDATLLQGARNWTERFSGYEIIPSGAAFTDHKRENSSKASSTLELADFGRWALSWKPPFLERLWIELT